MKKQELVSQLDEWLTEQYYQELSENTLSTYKNNVNNFIKWVDDDIEITKDITIKYKNYVRTKTNSSATANGLITALNKYFKWLDRNDLCIKKIKVQEQFNNESVLSLSDYKRLLRIAKRLDMMDMYYMMMTFAMTGIRIAELKFFTVENIQDYKIKIYNKGKDRYVPIHQDLRRSLKKYCKENNITTGLIFEGKVPNKVWSKATIHKRLKRIAGIARVKKTDVYPHAFRHLFAQLFLEANPGNYLDLADILGHNDLATTRKYTKLSNEQKRKKIENLKF